MDIRVDNNIDVIIDTVDNKVDTSNIDIEAIDISMDININDIVYIVIDMKSIDLSNHNFHVSVKTVFCPRLIEITSS